MNNIKKYQIEKYQYEVKWSEEDQIFIGLVAEFKSLAAHGNTQHQALEEIKNVVCMVIEDLQQENEPIPQPFSNRQYSGKLNIRIPKELHMDLTKQANKNEVSLNQFILYKLSR